MMFRLASLLLCAGLVLVGINVPTNSQSPFIPTTTAHVALTNAPGTRLVITGVAGQRVYVTGISFLAAATATLRVIQGTGATCGTGTANIINTTTFTSQETVIMGSGNGALWALTAGNSLCTVVGVADIGGFVSYTIF